MEINTGVYGKKLYIPFTHSEGNFYYIIELNDGRKIDLNDSVGGSKNNKDSYKLFEQLDSTFVNIGIKKKASMENFELVAK